MISRYIVGLVLALAAVLAIQLFLDGVLDRSGSGQATKYYNQGRPGISALPVLMEQAPSEMGIRKDDLQKYRRDNFAFRLETEIGYNVDGFADKVTKDLVSKPDTTVFLYFTDDELDRIYDLAIAIRFFEYPELGPPHDMNSGASSHYGNIQLTIRAGEVTKTVSWHSNWYPDRGYIDEWNRLYHLAEAIWKTVEARQEYRELPTGKGVYI